MHSKIYPLKFLNYSLTFERESESLSPLKNQPENQHKKSMYVNSHYQNFIRTLKSYSPIIRRSSKSDYFVRPLQNAVRHVTHVGATFFTHTTLRIEHGHIGLGCS